MRKYVDTYGNRFYNVTKFCFVTKNVLIGKCWVIHSDAEKWEGPNQEPNFKPWENRIKEVNNND